VADDGFGGAIAGATLSLALVLADALGALDALVSAT
jgi:hypothetical protein